MILPITLTIAAAAALLHIWLAARVSAARSQLKISVGDGGNEALIRRMRAHGNFTENAPFLLVLLLLLELATGGSLWLWGAAIVFILARILHAFGMDGRSRLPLRSIGMMTSTIVLAGLAGYAIYVAYQSPPLRGGITIDQGRSAGLRR